jgi:hypothetical protein
MNLWQATVGDQTIMYDNQVEGLDSNSKTDLQQIAIERVIIRLSITEVADEKATPTLSE